MATVSNFSELKTLIEDAVTTEIVVTNDITFLSGGARVNVAKKELIIDFGNHTVTDYNNLSVTDTIYIPSTTNTVSVTVKNCTWQGRNYYGVVGVYDGNTNSTITLQNIKYTGPQFCYNKNGTTNIQDCTIVLDKNGSSAAPQECGEVNRLNISGNVSITSNSTSNAVFWFTNANASLTVNENANFSITALSTYIFYTDVSPVLTFNQNSSTEIKAKTGLFYNSSSGSHIASSFTLKQNASFVASKTTGNSIPLFKCVSNFEIDENSSFRLYSESANSASLMYFSQAANIKLNSPKSFVLYNNGSNAFSFQTGSSASPNTFSISAEMLRLWDTAKTPLSGAGNLEDLPTSDYHKNLYASNLSLTVKTTNSQILTVESNLASGDSGYPLTSTSFKLLTSKVVALGNVALKPNEVSDISENITGTTEPNANVMAKYLDIQTTGSASSTGEFGLPANKIPVGTTIDISSNKDFLTKTVSVVSIGSISITKLEALKFYSFVSPATAQMVNRQNDNWEIEISDTRTSGGNWYLYAYILNPLSNDENKLENSLVFKSSGNTKILSDSPTLIYSGKWNSLQQKTLLSWEKDEGFLLLIDSNSHPKGNYSTDLYWKISTEPLT